MTELERIKEYNKTIRDVPVATDFAVTSIAKDFYGLEADGIHATEQIDTLRKWIYDNKNPDHNTLSQSPTEA